MFYLFQVKMKEILLILSLGFIKAFLAEETCSLNNDISCHGNDEKAKENKYIYSEYYLSCLS